MEDEVSEHISQLCELLLLTPGNQIKNLETFFKAHKFENGSGNGRIKGFRIRNLEFGIRGT